MNTTLNSLQLIRHEAEGQLSPDIITLFDEVIQDGSTKLKRLAEVQTVNEQAMGIGPGIEFPGGPQ
jgi:hypothetical protein